MNQFFLILLLGFISQYTLAENHAVAPAVAFEALTKAYQNQPSVADKDNAFVYLMGITAPENQDPIEFGKTLIYQENKITEGKKSILSQQEMAGFSSKEASHFKQKSHCYLRASKPCRIQDEEAWVRTILAKQKHLLSRLYILWDLPEYQYTLHSTDSQFLSPNYGIQFRLQQLFWLDLWIHRHDYSAEKIKQLLQKSSHFYRQQIRNTHNSLDKMMASALLAQHYYWLNELLQSVDAPKAAAMLPENTFQPFETDIFSMRKAYVHEFQLMQAILNETNLFNQNDLQRLFNAKAAVVQELIELSESKQPNIQPENSIQTPKAKHLYHIEYMMFEQYMMGKAMADMEVGGIVQLAEHIAYIRQLSAIQKAVEVLENIRRKAIPADAIVHFLQQPEQHNPLSQAPFNWDAQQQRITITHGKRIYSLFLSHAQW